MASTWQNKGPQPTLHPVLFVLTYYNCYHKFITLSVHVINIKRLMESTIDLKSLEPDVSCTIKEQLKYYFAIKHINTWNQLTHLFLVTHIWSTIKDNKEILGLFNNLDDKICKLEAIREIDSY